MNASSDDAEEKVILQLMSSFPSSPDYLQPHKLCSPRTWRLPHASAPSKTRDKSDPRNPLIDRSRCPTACLDCPASRAVDWISTTFLPRHLHSDLHRTHQFISYCGSSWNQPLTARSTHQARTSIAVSPICYTSSCGLRGDSRVSASHGRAISLR